MKDKKREKLLIGTIGLFLILAVMPGTAYAQVPQTINYQGYLTDNNIPPNPIDVQTDMTFRICSQDTADPAAAPPNSCSTAYEKWSEVHANVTVLNGIYNVILGEANSLTNDPTILDGSRWLEVTVEGEVLGPRQPLTSVAYSIRATVAESVVDNAVTGAKIQNGSVTDADIATNTVTGLKIQDESVTSADIQDFTATATELFLGEQAGLFNTGSGNTFIGNDAGLVNTTGYFNTFLGYGSGSANTTGYSNTFLGYEAGSYNTIAHSNTLVGSFAGYRKSSGSYNTFVGREAGRSLDTTWNTGGSNTYVGYRAGYRNTIGSNNTFLGYYAGNVNTSGGTNTFVGNIAGDANTTGSSNTFLGYGAGTANTTGYSNTFLGYYAGYSHGTGSGNTFLGIEAGRNNVSGTGNVFLGYRAGYSETGSGKLYIANSSTNPPLIYGDFSTGQVGIGTTSPATNIKLDVQGGNHIYGVYGGADHRGVWGESTINTGTGVYGYSDGGRGVYGKSSTGNGGYFVSSTGNAGYFVGPVTVTGFLTKAGGGFKIDHPLDPENKYLNHSFVESPDMKNIYDGVVVLDKNGEAWVDFPEWFEALNKDFRYHLTPIGVPGPNLHIAQEILENRFKIAGGSARMKVSWQVTGIRQDAFAKAHPLVVEEDKPDEERGTFLHPQAFGFRKERQVHYDKHAEMEERSNAK
jgi:hypothetical protein